MNQSEIAAAVAEQTEHIKRRKSCQGRLYVNHKFVTFRPEGTTGSVPASSTWSACLVCGVTETPEDYHRQLAAAGGVPRD